MGSLKTSPTLRAVWVWGAIGDTRTLFLYENFAWLSMPCSGCLFVRRCGVAQNATDVNRLSQVRGVAVVAPISNAQWCSLFRSYGHLEYEHQSGEEWFRWGFLWVYFSWLILCLVCLLFLVFLYYCCFLGCNIYVW